MKTTSYITVKTLDRCPRYKTYAHRNLWLRRPGVAMYRDFWAMPKEVPVIFDSYIMSENDLDGSLFRLLDADNRAVLPYLINARVLISSADVLHSWALPSIGVKLDATPGRLNQLAISRYQPGVLYGQCSEICGANHSYIPIVMEFINVEDFNH